MAKNSNDILVISSSEENDDHGIVPISSTFYSILNSFRRVLKNELDIKNILLQRKNANQTFLKSVTYKALLEKVYNCVHKNATINVHTSYYKVLSNALLFGEVKSQPLINLRESLSETPSTSTQFKITKTQVPSNHQKLLIAEKKTTEKEKKTLQSFIQNHADEEHTSEEENWQSTWLSGCSKNASPSQTVQKENIENIVGKLSSKSSTALTQSTCSTKTTNITATTNITTTKPFTVVTNSFSSVATTTSKTLPICSTLNLQPTVFITPLTELSSENLHSSQKIKSPSTDTNIDYTILSDTGETTREKESNTAGSLAIILLDDNSDGEPTPVEKSNKSPVANQPKQVSLKNANASDSSQTSQASSSQKMSKKAKIKYIVAKLERMEKQISSFQERDMSLDTMDSKESCYMQETRLKEEFIRLWKRYCKLTGGDTGEVINRRKKVTVTSAPFPEINRAVEKHYNKYDVFPNLFEVREVCKIATEKCMITVRDNDLHNISVDVFTELGRKLQSRRRKEFRESSGSKVTDNVKLEDDPAEKDEELKRKLKQNKKLAKQRTEHVFSDFVRQQYEQQALGTEKHNNSTEESGDANDDHTVSDDEELEQLRKQDLVNNVNIKRKIISKNAAVPPNKMRKKQPEKTIICVTVENEQPSSSKKIDVTINNPRAGTNDAAKVAKTKVSATLKKDLPENTTASKTSNSKSPTKELPVVTTSLNNEPLSSLASKSDIPSLVSSSKVKSSPAADRLKRIKLIVNQKHNQKTSCESLPVPNCSGDNSKNNDNKNDGQIFSIDENSQQNVSGDSNNFSDYSSPLNVFRKRPRFDCGGESNCHNNKALKTSSEEVQGRLLKAAEVFPPIQPTTSGAAQDTVVVLSSDDED